MVSRKLLGFTFGAAVGMIFTGFAVFLNAMFQINPQVALLGILMVLLCGGAGTAGEMGK